MNSYAKALLDIAEKENIVDQITYQFDEFNESVTSNPKWLKMMDSPMVSNDKKDQMIDQLGLNEHLTKLLKLLARANQMELYDDIYPSWVRMIRSKNNVAHINVYSVSELTDAQLKALTKKLQPRFKNQTLELHIKVRDNLIGGLRIVYQGQSLDNSIARELEELFLTL